MHDIPERHKLYRVSNIAYWTSTSKRYANWEATLEPVNLLPSGEFEVPEEHTVLGPNGVRLTKSKVLLGYVLAQYIDGDDEEPTRSDCVDLYIENAIEKLKAYHSIQTPTIAKCKTLKGLTTLKKGLAILILHTTCLRMPRKPARHALPR